MVYRGVQFAQSRKSHGFFPALDDGSGSAQVRAGGFLSGVKQGLGLVDETIEALRFELVG